MVGTELQSMLVSGFASGREAAARLRAERLIAYLSAAAMARVKSCRFFDSYSRFAKELRANLHRSPNSAPALNLTISLEAKSRITSPYRMFQRNHPIPRARVTTSLEPR